MVTGKRVRARRFRMEAEVGSEGRCYTDSFEEVGRGHSPKHGWPLEAGEGQATMSLGASRVNAALPTPPFSPGKRTSDF